MSDEKEIFKDAMEGLFGTSGQARSRAVELAEDELQSGEPERVTHEGVGDAESFHEAMEAMGLKPEGEAPREPQSPPVAKAERPMAQAVAAAPRGEARPRSEVASEGLVFEQAMEALMTGELDLDEVNEVQEEPGPARAEPPPEQTPAFTKAEAALFEATIHTLAHVPQEAKPTLGQTQSVDLSVGSTEVLRARVRRGQLRHTAELDLHGMTQEEAEEATRLFVRQCRKQGARILRVICGRGLHSSPGSLLLRDTLPTWLKVDLLEEVESAFSAPKSQGGEGAWYAILRR